MKLLKKYIVQGLLIMVASLLLNHASAQNDMLLHNFRIIPQSSLTNPSYMPEASGYVGMPGLSSVYFDIAHTGFAYDDVFKVRDDDSLEFDEDGIIDALSKQNYFNVSTHIQPLSFGFKFNRKNYISFAFNEKIDFSVSYPKDFMILMIKGNDEFLQRRTAAEFDAFQLNVINYHELSVGYVREIDHQWTAGIKGKLLFGQANIWTEKSDITYNVSSSDTSNYAYTAKSDLIINASFPFELSKDSIMDAIDQYADYVGDNPEDIASTDNMGYAVDLGVTYKPTRYSTFSLSVLDLGFIDWKRECMSFYNSGDFTFNGYPFRKLINDTTMLGDELTNLGDSIISEFDISEKKVDSYRTKLNTKIYLSGTYGNLDKHYMSFVFRGEFFYKRFIPSVSVSHTSMFGKAFGLTTIWSFYQNSPFNLGYGASFTSGPMQFYLLSDNAFSSAINYKKAQHLNVRFGLNILINKWGSRNLDEKNRRYVPSFYPTNRMINRF